MVVEPANNGKAQEMDNSTVYANKETGKHMENQKGEATKADMALDVDKKGTKDKVTMKKNINVLHGTCFIVSTIIGTGIFISPNSISRNVNSPAMSILIWMGGGIVATIGGITFCELGNMFPKNGAEITYLRQAYGALLSFLSCFLLHFVLSGLRMFSSTQDEK